MAKRRFRSRAEAGRLLADKLLPFKNPKPVILALPRGGVPVAFEVARKLDADLDILGVKKIGSPGWTELAIGAVSEDRHPWLNQQLIQRLGLDQEEVLQMVNKKTAEVQKQVQRLREGHPAISLEGRVVILIDDGIATGATVVAAVQCLRQRNVQKVIVATPVAPESSLQKIRPLADEVLCLETPFPFYAVGDWYEDFVQVEDQEVRNLLSNFSELPP